METPIVTVLISAYNRKKYLLDSVKSAITQSYPKEKYEIIVIKNFEDKEIDGFLALNKIRNIIDDSEDVGKVLFRGLVESAGHILTFLDDDDIFHRDKLEIVSKLFDNNSDLIYYRNSNQILDENGLIHKETIRRMPGIPVYLDTTCFKANELKEFIKFGGGFNLSSISVKKSVLEKQMEFLQKLTYNTDTFIFYSALNTGGVMLTDSKILTYYRIHTNNTSRTADDMSELTSRNLYYEGVEKNLSMILTMVTSPLAKKFLNCSILESRIKGELSDPDFAFRPRKSHMYASIRCSLYTGEKYRFLLGFWSIMLKIAPSMARKKYLRNKYSISKQFDVKD